MPPGCRGIVEGDADLPRGALPPRTQPRLARSRARPPAHAKTTGGASRLDVRPRGRLVPVPVLGQVRGRRPRRQRDRGGAVRTDRRGPGDRHRQIRTFHQRRRIMKRALALILTVAVAGLVAATGSAAAPKRSGDLHVTKESTDYHGLAGEFCTSTSSNIPAIKPGMRVLYASGIDPTTGVLDS